MKEFSKGLGSGFGYDHNESYVFHYTHIKGNGFGDGDRYGRGNAAGYGDGSEDGFKDPDFNRYHSEHYNLGYPTELIQYWR